ncbi:ribonuclease III [Fodinicurvata sediminis]|uniref:ribonuclease III n=1 Tax=Fodinicurvata sediminis TaxID=1121832 RepID=UPI0003B3BB28|nr:ribonuclease III [Fodinicurvata sediminis]
MPAISAKRISDLLEHEFSQPELLQEALTHSSRGENRSYERLEFLGDRVLALVVCEMLLQRFPKEPEGMLARRLAALVKQETLHKVASNWHLEEHVILSGGEEDSGGRQNPAILADVCEALLGALYLDGGLEAARRVIERDWKDLLKADISPPQDNKTRLQEWAQARGYPLPVYREVARSGPAHDPVFTIEVEVEGLGSGQGEGRSKRVAEQSAAKQLLSHLEG